MTPIRRRNILSMCKDIQEAIPQASIKDCFFTLYDDKDITGEELEYLIEWMTI